MRDKAQTTRSAADDGQKRLLDLPQHADPGGAGDQQGSGGAALNAERRRGADPVLRVAFDLDDLLIRNLDAKLVAFLAAVQPETVRIELQPTVESDASVPPDDRVTRHARIVVLVVEDGIRANHQSSAAPCSDVSPIRGADIREHADAGTRRRNDAWHMLDGRSGATNLASGALRGAVWLDGYIEAAAR